MVKLKARKSSAKPGAKKSAKTAFPNAKKLEEKASHKHPPVPVSAPAGRASTTRPGSNGHPRNAHTSHPPAFNEQSIGTIKSQAGFDLTEKIKELVRLAQEQGYLTYNDINDALPDTLVSGDELDEIYVKLRNLEVEIVDQAEVDRVKQPEPEEEEDKSRLDILDDPVRMYLKQMGQVPLLTREQEVEISKRIEEAEIMVQRLINRFGFIAQAHLDLAQKLTEGGERFDRVILDKKIESRERYMKMLPRLCKQVEKLSGAIRQQYSQILHGSSRRDPRKAKAFQKAVAGLQKLYPKFYFKQKVTEEFVHLADERYQALTHLQGEISKHPKDNGVRSPLGIKTRDLESSLWLSLAEYAE